MKPIALTDFRQSPRLLRWIALTIVFVPWSIVAAGCYALWRIVQ